MGRKLEFETGEEYHVYNRGVDKRITFIDFSDYHYFLSLLKICNSQKSRYKNYRNIGNFEYKDILKTGELVKINYIVLMPNHYHFRVLENFNGGLSKFMHKVMTSYALYFNKKYERNGPLFAGPFKAKHVDNEVYSNYLNQYLYYNPLILFNKNYTKDRISRDDFEPTKEDLNFLENYPYLIFNKD